MMSDNLHMTDKHLKSFFDPIIRFLKENPNLLNKGSDKDEHSEDNGRVNKVEKAKIRSYTKSTNDSKAS
ncbi:hypothetical protein EYB35_07195 [Bacillus paranthracis]|nr:hypothetical protein EYB35_07195 [Bacillus paranthracis]